MKKIQVILFALLTIISSKGIGQVKSDLEKENLKGKVKVIDEYEFEDIDISGKITDKMSYIRNITKFNNVGNYVEKKKIEDESFWLSTFFYDSNQIITKRIHRENDSTFFYYEDYKYNSEGNLIEWRNNVVWNKTSKNDTTFRDKTTYNYDSEGKLRSTNLWNGEQIFTSTFYY